MSKQDRRREMWSSLWSIITRPDGGPFDCVYLGLCHLPKKTLNTNPIVDHYGPDSCIQTGPSVFPSGWGKRLEGGESARFDLFRNLPCMLGLCDPEESVDELLYRGSLAVLKRL
jgi:hypothetical protein